MSMFAPKPAEWVPFRDMAELERVRNIKRADIEKHPNPDFKIKVVPDDQMEWIWVEDMFYRIWKSAQEGKKIVFITPNPAPCYARVASLINRFRINCSHVYTFNMDEWADQDGNIAPDTYPQSLMRAYKRFFYSQIDPELRMPLENVFGPTNENINDYSKMIADMGGADVCYSGPGWSGHIAFVDPDAPEIDAPLEEWKTRTARVVTLHPLSIAQQSLHGSFGMSGDVANVPTKGATIGPADVIGAKHRIEFHGITTAGTFVTWQRMASRLVLHGPVTPKVPSSILQTLRTDVYVSETLAADIEPKWDRQY